MGVKLTAAQNKIVEQIKRLHYQGRPLNISAIRKDDPRLLLEVYRIKPFWGWKQALEAAGVDYSKIKVELPECVKCRICSRRMRTLAKHLREVHGVPVEDYRAAHPGAETSSPAHDARLRRTRRLIVPHWEPNWSPEYVLDRLHELHRKGVPLNPTNIEVNEHATYWWAGRYFNNWDMALQAIGVAPKTARKVSLSRHWARQEVIKAIAARHARGSDVNWKAMIEHDKPLAHAAVRIFNSYDGALRACGLDPEKIRKYPRPKRLYRTKDDVISGIVRRRLQEKPMHDGAVSHGPDRDLSIWNKARRLFGGWRAAVHAAGLDYDKLSPRTPRYKSADAVLAEIRRRHDAGWPLTSMGVRKGPNKDAHLYNRAFRYFKDWTAAIKAAGIDYGSLRPLRGKYPTRESAIAAIRRRHGLGQALGYEGMRKGPDRDSALYDTGLELFGNWATAIESAGVHDVEVKRPEGKYPTKEAVLDGIRWRHGKGLPLTCNHLYKGPHADRALAAKALKYFTHWQTAMEKSGVDYATLLKKRRKYPSKDAIVAEIKRRHDAKLPYTAYKIQIGAHRDPALYDTAKKEFGSWQTALEAAKLDRM